MMNDEEEYLKQIPSHTPFPQDVNIETAWNMTVLNIMSVTESHVKEIWISNGKTEKQEVFKKGKIENE